MNINKLGFFIFFLSPCRVNHMEKGVCAGTSLKFRSDHGLQYDSNDFMAEMSFLGLDMSKAYVRQPECNGCFERFNQTLEKCSYSITSRLWKKPTMPSGSSSRTTTTNG